MELRHYLGIVRRSWPLVVALPALVGLLTLALAFLLPQHYVITAAMLVTQRPIGGEGPRSILPDQNNWNSWAASEYVVDDILQLVQTRQYADDIAQWLQSEHHIRLDGKQINDGLDAERKHRMIYLHVSADTATNARLIAEGGIAMLQQKGLEYWKREDTTTLEVSPLDLPERARPAKGLAGIAVDLVLRTLLALILAVGLAFLRHYLDQSIHQRGEVEALGLEVLGIIPLDGVRHPQPERRRI